MMATFKDTLGALGENAACFAKDFGGYAKDFGGKAADFGKDVGKRTSALAHRVGPKRGAIALGIVAAAIATPFIIRYVRARRARQESLIGPDGEAVAPKARRRAARGTVPHPADIAANR